MKPIQLWPIRHGFLLLALFAALTAQSQGLFNDYQQFNTAYNEKKYEQCAQLGVPLAKATNHPGIQYKLAECYCQAGQLPQSLALLGILAERGLPYPVEENSNFSKLYNDTQFVEYTAAFRKNRTVIDKSKVSFVIEDSLLIPEGIAAHSQHQTFYVGSLAKHKVLKCAGNGNCSDFAVGSQHGFWMALGMKVSPDLKSLWLCSAAEHDTLNGYSGLLQFDIASGKLLRKIIMDNKQGPHLFNDLVITASGDVFFTDSKAGKLWRYTPGSDRLIEFATDFVYPNGIAMDEKNKVLFVADFMGLHVIDMTTGKHTQLDHQNKTYLNGIDGLYYYKGTLLGIQDSGNQDDRIVRFYYDLKTNTITKTEILQTFRKDFIIPTTGTIVNGEFHYIANAQLRSLQPDGTITNPEKLVKPVILKLKIE
jgi:sugar lactone lactonase YvrE